MDTCDPHTFVAHRNSYFFMRPSRKSASRGVFLLPAPETPQKQPVSMYWVDDCGRMWYSGSKPAPNRSQLSASSQNDENVPPSPQSGGSFPLKLQDTNVVQGRKSLKRSRRTNSFCAPTQAYDTARCTFNDGLLLEDQQPVGVEIHAEHVMDDPLVSKAMVRQTAPLILFLVAIVAIDATVTSLGWSHILRSNQVGTLAVAAPQTPPLLTIHSTERDVLSNKVDITVDVVRASVRGFSRNSIIHGPDENRPHTWDLGSTATSAGLPGVTLVITRSPAYPRSPHAIFASFST